MLFQQASDSLSSEEENYGWRGTRARRRDSASSRRRGRDRGGSITMPNRKNRPDSSCGVRLFVAVVLLCLLAYELIVLYSPLAVQASFRAQTVKERGQREAEAVKPIVAPEVPLQAVSGADVASSARIAKDTLAEPDLPNRVLPPAAKTLESASRRRQTLASRALEIEHAADLRDEGVSMDQEPRGKLESGDGATRKSGEKRSTGPPRHQRQSRGDDEESDGIQPSAQRPSAVSYEKGTKPGANENFWDWFQESKRDKERNGKKIDCPEENQRLCQMFYKFVRKYKIRSVFDASCTKNIAWMTVVLKRISSEIWGFKYHCSETNEELMENAKTALQDFNFISFTTERWWRVGFPQDVELVFAWDVLAHTAYGRVWTFFVNVRKQEIKYVLVDNYPGILNDPSPERFYLNLRKHPFRFPAAKEVVQNVTEPGETANRQLLFYEGLTLPDNLG